MTRVGVLGGGPWGLALARAVRRAGSEATLLSRRHKDVGGIRLTTELAELAESPLIIIAVPSTHVQSIGRELGNHIGGGHMLVHGIRGLIGEDVRAISHILREETPARRLGALGGPVQASELNEGRPSAMVVGSEFSDVRRAVCEALQSEWLQVHEAADMRGVEWASALVGCLSIGVGFAQAREDVSPGLLAALISRAVDEAAAIAVAAGAKERTLFGLAGYGDLLASMALPNRPEVVIGRELASGATLEEAQAKAKLRVEAVGLVPRVVAYANRRGVNCEIFAALGNIIKGRGEPEQIVRALFSKGTASAGN
jgi:glycerol-3-phosphate dehydrogenase (NAD(P)+)